jgi:hypothetical protein
MLDLVIPILLTLLVGLGVLDLLLPSLAWRLHAWSKRREGIKGIQRTRQWEAVRVVRGAMMVLLAGALALFWVGQGRGEAPTDGSSTGSPAPIGPAELERQLLDGLAPGDVRKLQDSFEKAKDASR